MTKDELYTKKGEAHTQIELWNEILKQTNLELNKLLFPKKEDVNGQADKVTDAPRLTGQPITMDNSDRGST